MELKYYRCGDYLLPDLGLTEEEQKPVSKYGISLLSTGHIAGKYELPQGRLAV